MFINIITREVFQDNNGEDNILPLIKLDMLNTDKYYYESDNIFYDIDTTTEVTRYTKLEHHFTPLRPTGINKTRTEWIKAGYYLSIREDPIDITDYTLFGTITNTQYEFYIGFTNYKKKHPDTIKMVKKNELIESYNKDIKSSISFQGNKFSTLKDDIAIINSYLSAGILPSNFYYRSLDNNNVIMTYDELQLLSLAISNRNMECFNNLILEKEKL